MPICITIELYDKWSEVNQAAWKQAMLEHFTGSSVLAMGRELERRLVGVRDAIAAAGEEYGWTGQTVAALLVKQSAEDQGCGGMPTIVPCVEIDRGCEYVWRLFLGPDGKRYDLRCYAADYDRQRGCMLSMGEVDWRVGERI